jgi:hypothetical protein
MTDNPYQSPQTESKNDSTTDSNPPEIRKNALLAIAVGWNVPIVANFAMLFAGRISERMSNLLLAGWAATIPFFVLAFTYSPMIQRWIFAGPIEKSKHVGAWGIAGLWAILSGWWIYSILTGG